jgi:hypothetical protein
MTLVSDDLCTAGPAATDHRHGGGDSVAGLDQAVDLEVDLAPRIAHASDRLSERLLSSRVPGSMASAGFTYTISGCINSSGVPSSADHEA